MSDKEEKRKQIRAIDRLSTDPDGRFDSDAGVYGDLNATWTISKVKDRAQELGKLFEPNPEIADRLEADLAAGALVLFTESEVLAAIENSQVPEDWKEGLLELVTVKNDIAVIPRDSLDG